MIKRILCIALLVGCTETKTITEVEIVEVPVIKNSDALNQILDSFWSDFILFADIQRDSVYQFATARTFSFEGKEVIPVSAIRGVIVWNGDGNIIGTSLGSVYKSGTDTQVFELIPEEGYVHIVVFKKHFLAAGAYFSNYYTVVDGMSKIANFKSVEKKSVEKELIRLGLL